MPEENKEKGKAEEMAQKTGDFLGKAVKKGFGIGKSFVKGVKDAFSDKKEDKKS